jgi:hypothetical protein
MPFADHNDMVQVFTSNPQESSHIRSAQSARSDEGVEHPTKPTAARRSWPRWSSTCSSYGGDRIHVKKIELTRGAADARAGLLRD